MTPEREECLARLSGLILAVERPHPVRVAIDGPDAAGKTILADELAPLIAAAERPVIHASIDGFHRPRAERIARGAELPEGYFDDSFDYPALLGGLLLPLGPGGDRHIRRRVFDYRTDEPIDAPIENAAPNAILLLDGVFLLRRELAGLWDFGVFVDVPFAETQRRAATRDLDLFGSADEVLRRYASRYVPGQQLYFARDDPRSHADAVVENEDPDHPRLILPPGQPSTPPVGAGVRPHRSRHVWQ